MQSAEALYLVELLCSRLCHDLTSPIGAVKSGLELIAEFGDEPDGQAMTLIGDSVEGAAAKLRFFRVAFGLAGATQSELSLDDAAEMAAPVVTNRRVRLDWPKEREGSGRRPVAGGVKALLNVILLAAEALPRGGEVQVRLAPAPGKLDATVLAAASDARLVDEMRIAVRGEVRIQELTVRTVQGYFTWLVINRLGSDLTIEDESGVGISFGVEIPVFPQSLDSRFSS